MLGIESTRLMLGSGRNSHQARIARWVEIVLSHVPYCSKLRVEGKCCMTNTSRHAKVRTETELCRSYVDTPTCDALQLWQQK